MHVAATIWGYTVAYGADGSGHQIVLGYGDTYLSGGSGNDALCAWGGGNTLDGNSGNDVLIVMEGTGNTLIGASGNDILIGYVDDVFDGGSGRNEIVQMPVETSDILGTWEGLGVQGSDTWPLSVTITGGSPGTVVGTSTYPTLNCGGNLVLVSSAPGHLTLTEQLTYNGSRMCADQGTITLDLQSDGTLAFTWTFWESFASGTLYPVS